MNKQYLSQLSKELDSEIAELNKLKTASEWLQISPEVLQITNISRLHTLAIVDEVDLEEFKKLMKMLMSPDEETVNLAKDLIEAKYYVVIGKDKKDNE